MPKKVTPTILLGWIARIDPRMLGLGVLLAALYFVPGVSDPGDGLMSQPTKSILRSEKYAPEQIIGFSALVAIPWFFKPLYGLLSDFVPLAGYRRRSYLLVAGALAAAPYLILFLVPALSSNRWSMLATLIVAGTGVAWTSVVVDALMVEWGQPAGITGRLQSIRWTATWGASILNGLVGGYLGKQHLERWGFLGCGLLSLGVLILVALTVHEAPAKKKGESKRLKQTARALREAIGSRAMLLLGAFLFAWNFNPFSNAVLYIHLRDDLKLSEQIVGDSTSIFAVGSIVASGAYALYCRRISFPLLLKGSIICGCLSTLAYWVLKDRASAFVVSFIAGFFNMTGVIITLDLAARACPLAAAGTIFASLMSLTNVSSSLATWVGGRIYGWANDILGTTPTFHLLVALGCLTTALCWLFVPALTTLLAKAQEQDKPALAET